jgi:translation elongation factor EF-4
MTAPTVPYESELDSGHVAPYANCLKVVYRDRTVLISNPVAFPETTDSSLRVKEVREPVVKATIIVPERAYLLFQ